MRFIHTADWHIGKKLNGFDLLADQKDMLAQLSQMVNDYQVDALVVAGDIYDRSVPSVEAVALYNQAIETFNLEQNLPIFAISGNHDSAVRLQTGAPWYAKNHFYMGTRIEDAFQPVTYEDTQVFFLPYLEPYEARRYFGDEQITSIRQAVERIVAEMTPLFEVGKKHVLISHYFVAGSMRSESETPIEVGGLASVPREVFAAFDYTALGHLHSKNALKEGMVRYSGSPLCYSLSEATEQKGVLLVDTDTMEVTFLPIKPLRQVHVHEAAYAELLDPEVYLTLNREDFWYFELTDTGIIENAMAQLRPIYPNILGIQRKFQREAVRFTRRQAVEAISPEQLVAEFYQEHTTNDLTTFQTKWLEKAIQSAMDTEKRENACDQND